MNFEIMKNNFETINIGDEYSEEGVKGFVFEKKGNSNKNMSSEVFAAGIRAYNTGLSEHVLVWSKKYNQLLEISREK